MCGICGLLYFSNKRTVDSLLIQRMADMMAHRGPDGSGVYNGGKCGLGHRRLSIIDIASGHQPMTVMVGETELTIVFNGEIYNYLELRKELITLGHQFVTRSDTEVILVAYKEWGEACVERLRGMFSFAIWNARNQTLFAARDRIGIKPFYYHRGADFFIFGSEIKAILESSVVERQIEPLALDAFFSLGYVPGHLTMFQSIVKLLPGHCLTIDSWGRLQTRQYWQVCYGGGEEEITFEQAGEALEKLLKESVKMRMMSEVPIGVFLSGGLDSSAITAFMSMYSSQPIKTFSVGYRGAEEADELNYARIIARQFKTEHHEFILDPHDFFDSIPKLVSHTEEPLLETAAIPLFHISKKAKQFATVLLSGEGSDEIFAGYGLYSKMLSLEKWRRLFWLLKFCPDTPLFSDKILKYIDFTTIPYEKAYRGISADLTPRGKKRMYSQRLLNTFKTKDYVSTVFGEHFSHVTHTEHLNRLLYVDLKTWLVDDLLLKADKMTMAASVELRVPFLDHKVVEFAASLPASYKCHRGVGKYVLKKIMEKYLPNDIIYRKKMGFPVPTKRWFSNELVHQAREFLLSDTLLGTGYFNKKYIESILNSHVSGKSDHSRRIFSLLVFCHWMRMFVIK